MVDCFWLFIIWLGLYFLVDLTGSELVFIFVLRLVQLFAGRYYLIDLHWSQSYFGLFLYLRGYFVYLAYLQYFLQLGCLVDWRLFHLLVLQHAVLMNERKHRLERFLLIRWQYTCLLDSLVQILCIKYVELRWLARLCDGVVDLSLRGKRYFLSWVQLWL